MAKKTGTAREFILDTLRAYPDRELRVADLHELAGGKFTMGNMDLSVRRLYADSLVTKAVEPDRSVWWGIATGAGHTGR